MMLDMRPRCDRRRPNPSLPALHPSGTQRTQLDMPSIGRRALTNQICVRRH